MSLSVNKTISKSKQTDLGKEMIDSVPWSLLSCHIMGLLLSIRLFRSIWKVPQALPVNSFLWHLGIPELNE